MNKHWQVAIIHPTTFLFYHFFSPQCHSLHWHHASRMEQHYKWAEKWLKPHLQKSTDKQSKAPYQTENLGSLHFCWSSENLNFSRSVDHIIPPPPSWRLQIFVNCWGFFLTKETDKSFIIPHVAAWFLCFSSSVCSLNVLQLYFSSSFSTQSTGMLSGWVNVVLH